MLRVRAETPLAVLLVPVVLEKRARIPFAVLLEPRVLEKREDAPLAVLDHIFHHPLHTVTPFIRASPHDTSSIAIGAEVPIPTLAPLPSMREFEAETIAFAPIAVLLVRDPVDTSAPYPRAVLFDHVRLVDKAINQIAVLFDQVLLKAKASLQIAVLLLHSELVHRV